MLSVMCQFRSAQYPTLLPLAQKHITSELLDTASHHLLMMSAATAGPIAHPQGDTLCVSMESHSGMILTEINRRETCPSATLSTTNPARITLGANTGLRGKRPATNRLSHGTAKISNFTTGGYHKPVHSTFLHPIYIRFSYGKWQRRG
jgi:hypothetical protein